MIYKVFIRIMRSFLFKSLGLTAFLAVTVPMVCHADKPLRLSLSDTHTVCLSFPSSVKYVDFGSSDIKGGRTSHAGVITLRSVIPYFEETTASVVCSDGRYYSFLLSYSSDPEFLAVNMGSVSGGVIREKDSYSSERVEVSDIKTTHFVCEEGVTDIITGLDSIIADYADGIENIVRCKASADSFPETSLTIVTKEGYIYPFEVTYRQMPPVVNYRLSRKGDRAEEKAIFTDRFFNEAELERLGRKVIDEGVRVNTVGAFSQDIIFSMSALYIKDDILMFRFDLENGSLIDYEPDFLKMYITDKVRGKKTALQEDEIEPVHVYVPSGGVGDVIHGRETRSYVLFFHRFTIPTRRVLHVEVFEKNGGRHVGFTVSNKDILRARLIE